MTTSKLSLLVLISAFVFMSGCESKTESAKTDSGTHTHADGSVHSHGDGHSHDHGVEGHSHGAGPHGGTLADWGGGKFHVEFTVDHDKKEATVYIFGTDEKTAVPIDASEITLTIKDPSFTTTLAASPQDGDPEGKASRFIGNHDSLGVVQEYEGSMSGVVDDTPYSGNFKEEAEHHDH